MGNFTKLLCCIKQPFRRLVAIALCKITRMANGRPCREVKIETEGLTFKH